jgi:cellobiose phosphorylase
MDWTLNAEGFTLTRPHEYREWINYLSNDEYALRISHLGTGYATTLREPRLTVSLYDFFAPNRGRFVYVSPKADEPWSPAYYPAETPLDGYRCTHAPGFTGYEGRRGGLHVRHSLCLPLVGSYEIHSLEVANQGSGEATGSLSFVWEPLLYESMAVDPIYYSWFTNTKYESDALLFEKLHGDPVTGFMTSLPAPDSVESSRRRFLGDGNTRRPAGLDAPAFSSMPSGGDPYIGAFRWSYDLQPGESTTFAVFLGVGREALEEARTRFAGASQVDDAFRQARDHWSTKNEHLAFSGLPDTEFANYARTFLPYQIHQQSSGMVRSVFRGFRDVAQDAAGLSFFDPAGAESIIGQMAEHQHADGRCLRQWNTSGGAHDERDFRDLPFWFPFSIAYYVRNGGDPGILERSYPFLDGSLGDLRDHVERGLRYALQFGNHGFLNMGAGDWNDALSGLGESGGSVWLNQFAYYSLGLWDETLRKCGLESSLQIDELRNQLYDGTMAAWNGKWFHRGITAERTIVGGPERVFLLPQAWFTISGMAERDPEKGAASLAAMLERLANPHGLQLCAPGFESYDEAVGNLSALAPGLAENFAVYNHASAFGIYALLCAGRKSEALDYLRRLLPYTKDYHETKSEPYVLVNYYNGGYYTDKLGEGGIPWLTSTVSWLAMILFEFLIPDRTFP